MARLESASAAPVKDSVDPTLLFRVQARTLRLEALVRVWAEIFANDGKLLSQAEESPRADDQQQNIAAQLYWDTRRATEEQNRSIELCAKLSQKAIDHIESLRDHDDRGDVHLTLRAYTTTLRSQAYIRPTESLEIPNYPQNYVTTTPKNVQNWSSNRSTDWILAGNTSPDFLAIVTTTYGLKARIPAGDWVQDFAPALGIGRFIVAELPIVASFSIIGNLSKEFARAAEAMGKMEQRFHDGEWDEVVKESRPVMELLRLPEFKKFLEEKLDYPQDAVDALWNGLNGLFDFPSKFIHATTQSRAVRPTIRASKEEAYLVYSTALGLVNLIGRKLAKESTPEPVPQRVFPY